MNIIKRIGIALHLVLIDAVTKDQAKWLIENYRKEFGEPMDHHRFQELQRRSEKLAYIEGCGYELKSPVVLKTDTEYKGVQFKATEQTTPPNDGKRNGRNEILDGVLRSIDRLQKKRFTSGDVWAEYVRAKEPQTTRDTVFVTVSRIGRSGLIQRCNPPRMIGNSFVYEKQ